MNRAGKPGPNPERPDQDVDRPEINFLEYGGFEADPHDEPQVAIQETDDEEAWITTAKKSVVDLSEVA